MIRIAYIGNFGPPHSTENHVRQAFSSIGVEVTKVQENDLNAWKDLVIRLKRFDFVLWTRTWDVDWAREYLALIQEARVPVIGFHLDRWWGLKREHQVNEQAFFQSDLVITADGGHPQEWLDAGINHHWLPPAVSEFECQPAPFTRRFASEIAFVGSWNGYHPEWGHRAELVDFLRRTYGERVAFWPEAGQPSVRGEDLRRLYASTRVVVGDSCLVGGATHYCSDRIPETIGRGGFLIHPFVRGVTDGTHYMQGEHLDVWDLGDWDSLQEQIDRGLSDPGHCQQIARQGREHVLKHHTYTVRARQVLELARGLQ